MGSCGLFEKKSPTTSKLRIIKYDKLLLIDRMLNYSKYNEDKKEMNEAINQFLVIPHTVNQKKIGFKNIGNSCYMNAALNVLIRQPFPDFNSILIQLTRENSSANQTNILFTYSELLKNTYCNNETEYNTCQLLKLLKNQLATELGKLDNNQQEDSMGFYRDLVCTLLEKYKVYINIEINEKIPSCTIKEKHLKHFLKNYYQRCYKNEDIFSLFFCGTFAYIMPCSICYYLNLSFEEFLDFSLSTFDNRANHIKKIKIDELIDNDFKNQILDNPMMCKSCLNFSLYFRVKYLLVAPKILPITLDPINLTTNKKDLRIIDKIDKICLNDYSIEKVSIIYYLYATINHLGDAHGGHYIRYNLINISSHIKDSEGWFEYNDKHVIKSNLEKALINATSLIFYRSEIS